MFATTDNDGVTIHVVEMADYGDELVLTILTDYGTTATAFMANDGSVTYASANGDGYPIPYATEEWYAYARRELGMSDYESAANVARMGSFLVTRTVSL